METQLYKTGLESYYMKQEDKLVWCKIVSANFVFDKTFDNYKLHYVLQTEQGVISVDDPELQLYDKNGIRIPKNHHWEPCLSSRVTEVESGDGTEYETVVFDGVTPVRKRIYPIVATRSYENGRSETVWNIDLKECYKDENECANWNRCLVREKDGTEHWVEGRYYKLRLSDDQVNAVKSFEEACCKLVESGVRLLIGEWGDYVELVTADAPTEVSYENPSEWGDKDNDWYKVDEDRIMYSAAIKKAVKHVKSSDDNSLWIGEAKQ